MSSITLLLVEDEPNNVTLFEYALKKTGFSNPLRVAKDGVEAIEYLAGTGAFADRQLFPLPGLIVLDLKMPRATGFEVLEWIRQQPGLKQMIVLIFSASAAEADVSEAYALGANAYMVKPSRLEDLVKMVQSIKDFWINSNQASVLTVLSR